MTDEEKECLLNRIELVHRNLRNCNSACEAHEVGNMRNVCVLLEHMIRDGDGPFGNVHERLCRLEAQTVKFFQKKFAHLNPKNK